MIQTPHSLNQDVKFVEALGLAVELQDRQADRLEEEKADGVAERAADDRPDRGDRRVPPGLEAGSRSPSE